MGAEPGWESAYVAFVEARRTPYRRAAGEVLGNDAVAAQVVEETLERLYQAWPRTSPGQVDDVARRLLVARLRSRVGRRTGRRLEARVLASLDADVDRVDSPAVVLDRPDLPSDPDLERLLLAARRRRQRVRRTTAGVAGGVLLAAAALVVAVTGPGSGRPRPLPDLPARPQIVNFVVGTQVDEQMQRRIREHFPDSGQATLVYMGDPARRGPLLPDWLFAQAFFWEADYALADGEQLSVLMSYPSPGMSPLACGPGEPGAPPCSRTKLGPGTAVTFGERIRGSDVHWFVTRYVAPGGFAVTVREGVSADSWRQATGVRDFDPGQVIATVTDPALRFPPPRPAPGQG